MTVNRSVELEIVSKSSALNTEYILFYDQIICVDG